MPRLQKTYRALPIEPDEEQTRYLKHPEWLEVRDPETDQQWPGGRQQWYPEKEKQKRGCGPTTAAEMTAYLARKGRLVSLYQPFKGAERTYGVIPAVYRYERAGFTLHMQDLWYAFEPKALGIPTVSNYQTKLKRFARSRGIKLESKTYVVHPWTQRRRRNFRRLVTFIQEGLDEDLPLAFLNYHGGQAREITPWHWMTVIGLRVNRDNSQAELIVTSHGRLIRLSLDKWFYTARSGGGFVSLTNPAVLYELVGPQRD